MYVSLYIYKVKEDNMENWIGMAHYKHSFQKFLLFIYTWQGGESMVLCIYIHTVASQMAILL